MYNNNNSHTVISTEEPVYGDSTYGSLEHIIGISMRFPLHKLFYSDSIACFPVAVHNQTTTLTTVDGVVPAIMGGVHRTAPRTPLTRVIRVYIPKRNAIINAPDDYLLPDKPEGYEANLPVSLLVFIGSELGKFLHHNFGVILHSKLMNLLGDFACAVPGEVPEFTPEKLKASLRPGTAFTGEVLELAFPFKYLGFFSPDAFAEVELLQDFTFFIDNCDSNIVGVYVNTQNIFCFNMLLSLLDDNENLIVGGDGNLLQPPTISDILIKTIQHTITLNGESDTRPRSDIQFHTKSAAIKSENLTGTGNVTVESDPTNTPFFRRLLLQAHAIADEIQNHLRMKIRSITHSTINLLLKFTTSLSIINVRHDVFMENIQSLTTITIKNLFFTFSQFKWSQNNCFLHTNPSIIYR